jgi:hypothetical protein
VRKLAIFLMSVVVAGSLSAATLVLKGGKTLAVQGFSQQGNLMVVQLADGRIQSYPLTAVDMTATSAANPAPPAPEVADDKGPRSPFAAARASEGTGALVVTDKDVNHFFSDGTEGDAQAEEAGKEKAKGDGSPAQVVPRSYSKKAVGEDQWELTVILVNQGGSPASGIGLTVRAIDAEGKDVGSATGSSPDKLDPGQQTTVVVAMPAIGVAKSFGFDASWQSITAVPSPKPGEAATGGGGAKPAAPPAPVGTPKVTRYLAPPNTMLGPATAPGNPNAVTPLTAPPTPAPGA